MIGWIRDASSDVARLSPYIPSVIHAAVADNALVGHGRMGSFTSIQVQESIPNTIHREAVGDVNQDGILMSGDGGLITDIRAY